MALSKVVLSSLVVALLTAGSAGAQDSSKYFTVLNPGKFDIDWAAFYRQCEKRTAETRDRLPHHLNLPYGHNIKQQLDLYLPREKSAGAVPVFLFLHGGGFREGDRAQYGFIAEPLAKHGIATAVASYRLTDDGFRYPSQPEDARLAVKWLFDHAAEYGLDPGALYVGGHSAGAILSADLGVDRGWMEKSGIPKSALRGIAPVSGRYDLRIKGIPGEGDVYAPSEELSERASPILHIKDPVPVVVIGVGSTEATSLKSSLAFAGKIKAGGAQSSVITLEGQDHKDTALAMADENSPLFKAILQMILHTGSDHVATGKNSR